jgi:hypothetical protein
MSTPLRRGLLMAYAFINEHIEFELGPDNTSVPRGDGFSGPAVDLLGQLQGILEAPHAAIMTEISESQR